jgi:hypothetical protein
MSIEKASKSAVHYRDGDGALRCKNCTKFVEPDVCTHVAGEINPAYVCDRFVWQEPPKGGAEDSVVLAYDKASVRNYDADGRLHVERTPISKANICEYWGREIPDAEALGLQADRKYRLLRHPDELRKGADTFNNMPLLRDHVPVSANDHQPDKVIGSTGTDAKYEHPYLTNSLVVWAKDDIEKIEQDLKRELSSAYRYRADMTPGTYENQPYDGVMRDLKGNHLAVVREGRAGADVLVMDAKTFETEITPMSKTPLTRKATLVQGALTGFLLPRLAADAKIDVAPLLASVTAANYASERASILESVTKAAKGKLASDAKLDGLDRILLALDALEAEEDDKDKKKAEDADCDMPKPGMKGDKKAKDKKARDGSDDDMDAMDEEDDPEDEDADPEKTNGKKAKDKKAKDAEMKDGVTKSAMDAALENERARQREVRDAERFVRPWVGDLTIAYDSADDVYKAALEARGKPVKGIHPSAYRTILEMLPKPGTENRVSHSSRVAMDSAGTKSFADMYPGAMNIRITA